MRRRIKNPRTRRTKGRRKWRWNKKFLAIEQVVDLQSPLKLTPKRPKRSGAEILAKVMGEIHLIDHLNQLSKFSLVLHFTVTASNLGSGTTIASQSLMPHEHSRYITTRIVIPLFLFHCSSTKYYLFIYLQAMLLVFEAKIA